MQPLAMAPNEEDRPMRRSSHARARSPSAGNGLSPAPFYIRLPRTPLDQRLCPGAMPPKGSKASPKKKADQGQQGQQVQEKQEKPQQEQRAYAIRPECGGAPELPAHQTKSGAKRVSNSRNRRMKWRRNRLSATPPAVGGWA